MMTRASTSDNEARAAADIEVASEAPSRCDLAIVGGGIVGLALARELTRRHPRLSVCVLEREAELGAHQTGHNSGVIHAGVYYQPGSLKARLCVEGARELYAYCAEREIPHEACGKLIVATERSELGRLEELERRGRANGGPRAAARGRRGIRELEPHARGIAGLHSPATGIVDFAAVARSYARDALAGGRADRERLRRARRTGRRAVAAPGARARRDRGRARALLRGRVVGSAGGGGGRGPGPAHRPLPRRLPAPGTREREHLVRSLIYPVPDPALPFLGVHLTRHIDGEVLIGPTALPVLARDAYRLGRVRREDALDTLRWPGTWRMLARLVAPGRRPSCATRPRGRRSRGPRLATCPSCASGDVRPAFAGVRAQALGPRRAAGRRLRVLRHRAGAARAQRALAGGHLLAGDRPLRRRPRGEALARRCVHAVEADGESAARKMRAYPGDCHRKVT